MVKLKYSCTAGTRVFCQQLLKALLIVFPMGHLISPIKMKCNTLHILREERGFLNQNPDSNSQKLGGDEVSKLMRMLDALGGFRRVISMSKDSNQAKRYKKAVQLQVAVLC